MALSDNQFRRVEADWKSAIHAQEDYQEAYNAYLGVCLLYDERVVEEGTPTGDVLLTSMLEAHGVVDGYAVEYQLRVAIMVGHIHMWGIKVEEWLNAVDTTFHDLP